MGMPLSAPPPCLRRQVKDSYNVNALTQLAGEAALLDRDYFRWLVGETIKQRKVRPREQSPPSLRSLGLPPRPRSHPPPRPHRPLTLAPTLTLPLAISPSRQALEAACKGFGWTWPTSDANFLLVEVGSAAKAGALYERCRDGGVLVRYWGSRPELATKLRVTVGTKESVDKFVSIVAQALPSLEGM